MVPGEDWLLFLFIPQCTVLHAQTTVRAFVLNFKTYCPSRADYCLRLCVKFYYNVATCIVNHSNANNAALFRTKSRPLTKCIVFAMHVFSRASANAKHTIPTGFSGVPPKGPAIPVMDNATSASKLCNAPLDRKSTRLNSSHSSI